MKLPLFYITTLLIEALIVMQNKFMDASTIPLSVLLSEELGNHSAGCLPLRSIDYLNHALVQGEGVPYTLLNLR